MHGGFASVASETCMQGGFASVASETCMVFKASCQLPSCAFLKKTFLPSESLHFSTEIVSRITNFVLSNNYFSEWSFILISILTEIIFFIIKLIYFEVIVVMINYLQYCFCKYIVVFKASLMPAALVHFWRKFFYLFLQFFYLLRVFVFQLKSSLASQILF